MEPQFITTDENIYQRTRSAQHNFTQQDDIVLLQAVLVVREVFHSSDASSLSWY